MLIPALSGAAATQLSAKLKGNEEVADGDPNGRGEAFVAVKKPRKRKLCFEVSWEKVGPPTAAHIHKGAKGTDGPIKVTLFEDPDGLTAFDGGGVREEDQQADREEAQKGAGEVPRQRAQRRASRRGDPRPARPDALRR